MWRYESDGGPIGNSWQPKTHYLINDNTDERIDCDSKREALNKMKELNQLEKIVDGCCGGCV